MPTWCERCLPDTPILCRKLEITLFSADNLPRPGSLHLRRMKVYAEVTLINDDSKTTKKTDVIKIGGETNAILNLKVEQDVAQPTGKDQVIVKLLCKRSLRENSVIGEVSINLKSLWDKRCLPQNLESCGVDGTPNGKLHFFYSFG